MNLLAGLLLIPVVYNIESEVTLVYLENRLAIAIAIDVNLSDWYLKSMSILNQVELRPHLELKIVFVRNREKLSL